MSRRRNGVAAGALIAAAWALPVAAQEQPTPAAASEWPAAPGQPEPLRMLLPTPAEEDWSFLKDPGTRTDPFDVVKYVPLGGDGYVSFGGQAKAQVEYYRNAALGQSPGRDAYGLFRLDLHADVHPDPNWRLFVATQSATVSGRRGGPRAIIDRNELDLLEGFVEWHGGFDDQLKGPATAIRIGRQQLDFGAGRILSSLGGPDGVGTNVLQGFDGPRAIVRRRLLRVDFLATKPTEPRPGVFNDGWVRGGGLWGAYATWGGAPGSPMPGIDAYYIGTRREQATFFSARGPETRHSLGLRASRKQTPFEYDVEGTYQVGRVAGRRIAAWSLSGEFSYTFQQAPWSPQPAFRFGVNSGDKGDGVQRTFFAPFPRGAYFGNSSPIGPSNTTGFEVGLMLHPTKSVTVKGGTFFFWRTERRDGVYQLFGFPIAPPTNGERYIGTQPVFQATWKISPHLTAVATAEHFSRGAFLKGVPGTRDVDYAAAWLVFQF